MRKSAVSAVVVAALVLSSLAIALPSYAAASYTSGAPGDANCDAAVTSADVLVILRVLAGLESADLACAGDTDGDGLDIDDARVIRRWVAGLPVPPRLVEVLPGSVPVGSPDTTFTLTGGFIAPNTVVAWNGTPYAVTLIDGGSRATVVVPAVEFATEDPGTVRLQTPGQPLSAPFSVPVTEPGSCSKPVATSGTLVVDKVAETATFTLTAPQNMTGWTLWSQLGDQTYHFPAGYHYNPMFGPVTVFSGISAFENSQTHLWWTGQNVWNNSNPDPGFIRDCSGNVIAQWLDP